MMIIENNKSCNSKDIALSLNVNNAIITRNIKKLEDLNYVVKVKRLNDNSFFDLCLTDEGISIFKLINEYQEKWYEKVIKNFNKEESDTLINLLHKLCSNI
nr:MarR family transcriptional regulator [Terrisporobacter petrolearius]